MYSDYDFTEPVDDYDDELESDEPSVDERTIKEKLNFIFQKLKEDKQNKKSIKRDKPPKIIRKNKTSKEKKNIFTNLIKNVSGKKKIKSDQNKQKELQGELNKIFKKIKNNNNDPLSIEEQDSNRVQHETKSIKVKAKSQKSQLAIDKLDSNKDTQNIKTKIDSESKVQTRSKLQHNSDNNELLNVQNSNSQLDVANVKAEELSHETSKVSSIDSNNKTENRDEILDFFNDNSSLKTEKTNLLPANTNEPVKNLDKNDNEATEDIDGFLKSFVGEELSVESITIAKVSTTPRYFEVVANPLEYFAKWISNLLLTILTFGLYMPSSRIITKDYLAFHTTLNGSFFEYKNRIIKYLPIHILFAVVVLSIVISIYLKSKIAIFCFSIVFLLMLPFTFYKLREFDIESLSYRNIKFSFKKVKVSGFYRLFLSIYVALLIPLTVAVWIFKSYKSEITQLQIVALFELLIVLFCIVLLLIISQVYKGYVKEYISKISFGNSKIKFQNSSGIVKVFSTIALFTFISLSIILLLWYLLDNNFRTIHVNIKFIIFSFFGVAVFGFLKGVIEATLHNYIFNGIKIKENFFQSRVNVIKFATTKCLSFIASFFTLFLVYPLFQIILLKLKIKDTQFICDECDDFIEDSV